MAHGLSGDDEHGEVPEIEREGDLPDVERRSAAQHHLRPSPRHHPVERWVKPEEFVELAAEAERLGFLGVMSGPLVRSSYRAGRLHAQAVAARAAGTGTATLITGGA